MTEKKDRRMNRVEKIQTEVHEYYLGKKKRFTARNAMVNMKHNRNTTVRNVGYALKADARFGWERIYGSDMEFWIKEDFN